MYCRRGAPLAGALLACAFAAACGIKGPPRPPLPRGPEPPRGVELRQSGPDLEVSWLEPERRQNGRPIEEPLTYEVRALAVERPAAPPAPGPSAPAPTIPAPSPTIPAQAPGSSAPAPTNPAPAPGPSAQQAPIPSPVAPGTASPLPTGSSPAGVSPPGGREGLLGGDDEQRMRRIEAAFMSASTVVTTVQGRARRPIAKASIPPATALPDAPTSTRELSSRAGGGGGGEGVGVGGGAGEREKASEPGNVRERPRRLTVRIGPDRFAGTRLSSARLEIAVLARDAGGRRSPPRPILKIDPIEPLPALVSFTAEPAAEGVLMRWTIPHLPEGALPVRVNVYRAITTTSGTQPGMEAAGEGAGASAAAPEGTEPSLLRGSPFAGDEALDDSVRLGERYLEQGRLVHVGPGAGLREGPPSPRVVVDYADRFPPSAPGLVTADALGPATKPGPATDAPGGSWSVRVAWSPPIDADVGGYRIHRAGEDGESQVVASVPATETQWLDSTTLPGRRYRYFVTAIDGARPPNESPPSETVVTITEASEEAGGTP